MIKKLSKLNNNFLKNCLSEDQFSEYEKQVFLKEYFSKSNYIFNKFENDIIYLHVSHPGFITNFDFLKEKIKKELISQNIRIISFKIKLL